MSFEKPDVSRVEKLIDDADIKVAVYAKACLLLPETLLMNSFNDNVKLALLKKKLETALVNEQSRDVAHLQAIAGQTVNNTLEEWKVEKHSVVARDFQEKLKREMEVHHQ